MCGLGVNQDRFYHNPSTVWLLIQCKVNSTQAWSLLGGTMQLKNQVSGQAIPQWQFLNGVCTCHIHTHHIALCTHISHRPRGLSSGTTSLDSQVSGRTAHCPDCFRREPLVCRDVFGVTQGGFCPIAPAQLSSSFRQCT